MAYDPSIIAAIKRRAAAEDPAKRNKFLRAALQIGIVESGLQNLPGGDADSQGWRQERKSLYSNPTNVNASVNRVFNEFEQLDRGQSSWELAADVQRPAAQYRGRYQDVAGEAAKLAGGSAGGGTQSTASQLDGVPAETQPVAAPMNQLADLKLAERPNPQIAAPTAPTFSAMAPVPNGYQTPQTAYQPKARFDQGAVVEALQALKAREVEVPKLAPEASTGATGGTSRPRASAGGGTGRFKIDGPAPGRLKPELTSFAKKVAAVYGGTLEGLDGSSHSKYTVNGNVSEHYSGNATDIFKIGGKPAVGARLIAAGRAALEAAGMPASKARKAPGGLYNVGNHQIIFGVNGTQYGGDHTDHLHISTHAR